MAHNTRSNSSASAIKFWAAYDASTGHEPTFIFDASGRFSAGCACGDTEGRSFRLHLLDMLYGRREDTAARTDLTSTTTDGTTDEG